MYLDRKTVNIDDYVMVKIYLFTIKLLVTTNFIFISSKSVYNSLYPHLTILIIAFLTCQEMILEHLQTGQCHLQKHLQHHRLNYRRACELALWFYKTNSQLLVCEASAYKRLPLFDSCTLTDSNYN